MGNFAVAASADSIEKAKNVMKMYAKDGEKQEETLLRIMSLAEKEIIRGTHPALEERLKTVDGTISTLIKQINGIVAGQDAVIEDIKERLEMAIKEKNDAIESAKQQSATAKKAIDEAQIVAANAQQEIIMAKKEAQAVIEKAQSAADRAVQERDDARIIAEEKTKNTDLLLKQIQDAQSDLDAYKALQSEYDKLSVAYTDLQHQLETAKLEANLDKERAMRDLEMENVRLNALLEKK